MLSVTEARYLKDYQIQIAFNDDLKQVIEKDYRPIFQELRDQKKFSQIKLDMDTIVWKNGLDLSPEFIHELLMQQNKNNK